MPEKKQYPIDIEGTDIVSKALLVLLNQFPGLDGKEIKFSTLADASGIGFFPTSGAVLLSSAEDITGHVRQVCLYPFTIVYRAALRSDAQKMRVKEFLDALGKWLECQPVILSGAEYKLAEYPALDSRRTIKSISRTNPGHLNAAYQDGIEDWMLAATLRYETEFDK